MDHFLDNIKYVPSALTHRHSWLLYGLVRWLRPQVVVEVGAFHGYSSAHIALALEHNNMPDACLIAIDDFSLQPDSCSMLHNNLAGLRVGNRVYIHSGKSDDPANWPDNCDMAYIDGDHSEEGCIKDVANAMARGAKCIVIHDTYSWWGPRAFSENFKDEGWERIEGMFDEGLLVLLKKEERPPVTYSKEDYPDGYIHTTKAD